MSLINPKPRFAYDPDADMIYDYVRGRDVPLVEAYTAPDGVWDLTKVKALILAGGGIEGARVGELRHDDAPVAVLAPSSAVSPAATPSSGGFSAAELIALKFTAIQAAALGLKPDELISDGVTGDQVRNWGINAARAEALRLTPEQRAVLCP